MNNAVGTAACVKVPPVNLTNLTPQPKDELQPPESSRSTLSGRSWITDDKWSDDDDDDDEIASRTVGAATSFMPKASTGKVAPPVAVLGSHLASGSSSEAVICQLLSTRCIMYDISLISCSSADPNLT